MHGTVGVAPMTGELDARGGVPCMTGELDARAESRP
jgi:hypothetical protein